MDESKAPAGWYPHPDMAETQRYWDGEEWTGQVAPSGPTTDTPSWREADARADIRQGIGSLIIAAIALVIALSTHDDTLLNPASDTEATIHGIASLAALIAGAVGLWMILRALFRRT